MSNALITKEKALKRHSSSIYLSDETPLYATAHKRILSAFLPEILDIEAFATRSQDHLTCRIEAKIPIRDMEIPIYSIAVGDDDLSKPVLVFVGGIHGIERIGTHVVNSFLQTIIERLLWDDSLKTELEKYRLLFIPLVNPSGMFFNIRSNAEGIDLMRNAPIDAVERTPMLVGGQRFSPKLPWYRGATEKLAAENNALLKIMREQVFPSRFSILLDCHSGFGFHDRIWFPYAYRRHPIGILKEIFSLKLLLDQTLPHHNYTFEPQSTHYITHGDFWDYSYKLSKQEAEGLFIPLTLEMGSWRWVKKNPLQMVKMMGLFNPVKPHRLSRTKRRHLPFFEFLARAVYSHKNWLPTGQQNHALAQAALSYWFKNKLP
ncbi:MAG: DUF2817 domain-containing protein [Pseudomonadota bacterium]